MSIFLPARDITETRTLTVTHPDQGTAPHQTKTQRVAASAASAASAAQDTRFPQVDEIIERLARSTRETLAKARE